jgi:hypothetical protein
MKDSLRRENMKTFLTSLLAALVILGFSLEVPAQPIRVGSVTEGRFQSGLTLDGPSMVSTRAKLLNPANFGPSGTVPRTITILDRAGAVGSVNAELLANFDVFFTGYFYNLSANAFTPAELAAFQSWVNAGGTMIVTCDGSDYDAVCASFGHPSTTQAIGPIVPTAAGAVSPLFNGPFGTVSSILMVGDQGFFTSTAGATVLAKDSSGPPLPTLLIQPFGLGRVVFMSDAYLDARSVSQGASITIQNDKFAGNLFAFAGSCSGTGMCLSSSRFLVTADWQSTTASGQGTAVQLTSDTGYFWFFSSSNLEMVVKSLDGCGVNGKKWVFAGGLTNVDVTLTVTDLQTGVMKTYLNPQGTAFLPIQDTDAFSACP